MTHTKVIYEIFSSSLQLGLSVIIILLQRWLLGLSTYQKDMAWFKQQKIYKVFASAKWYRGTEFYYQWNAFQMFKANGL